MMASGQGLLHIKLVQRAYELSHAVGTLARQEHLPEIGALLETLAAVPQMRIATEVSDEVALIAHLVLEDHAITAPQVTRSWSAAGFAALQLIQQAAFPCGPHSLSFHDLVRCTSTLEAAMVCSMCHTALRDVICDSSTCIPLLMTAEAQQWRTIESRCLDVAMDHLPSLGAAAQRLSQHALKRILSSDTLKVESEVEVWHVLETWLDADLTARFRSVASFMTGPLRLLQLSRNELDQVDCHPAIRRCGISSRLVAAAYLHASGHAPDLCSQMASPSLWAVMATAQPRLSVAKAAQPATPCQAGRAALTVVQPAVDISEGGVPSPPFQPLVNVTPVRLQADTPVAEAPSAMEPVVLCPAPPWMISSNDWDDATEAAWDQKHLARRRKRARRL